MRNLLIILISFSLVVLTQATNASDEKPIKHLNIADVGSMDEAKKVFVEKTFEMSTKQKLDATELQQIHIITYSLEKSVAYFAEHLSGEKQKIAQEMAVVVENIHLNSENSRQEKTRQELVKYFELANKFIYTYWQVK